MTGGTTDAFGDVDAVVKVHELWEVVDAVPLDRFVFGITVADEFKFRALGQNLRMATHAGFDRGNIRMTRDFDTGVAIATI